MGGRGRGRSGWTIPVFSFGCPSPGGGLRMLASLPASTAARGRCCCLSRGFYLYYPGALAKWTIEEGRRHLYSKTSLFLRCAARKHWRNATRRRAREHTHWHRRAVLCSGSAGEGEARTVRAGCATSTAPGLRLADGGGHPRTTSATHTHTHTHTRTVLTRQRQCQCHTAACALGSLARVAADAQLSEREGRGGEGSRRRVGTGRGCVGRPTVAPMARPCSAAQCMQCMQCSSGA